jgi:hypothetical protein
MSDNARGPSRVGVLVLRVWRESADPGGLRVHVRGVADVVAGDEEVIAVASVPEAVDVVRRWLEQRAADFAQPP